MKSLTSSLRSSPLVLLVIMLAAFAVPSGASASTWDINTYWSIYGGNAVNDGFSGPGGIGLNSNNNLIFGGGSAGVSTENRLCSYVAPGAYYNGGTDGSGNVNGTDNHYRNDRHWVSFWTPWTGWQSHNSTDDNGCTGSTASCHYGAASVSCAVPTPGPSQTLTASPGTIDQGGGSIITWDDSTNVDPYSSQAWCWSSGFNITYTHHSDYVAGDCVAMEDPYGYGTFWGWDCAPGYYNEYDTQDKTGSVNVYPSQSTTYGYYCQNQYGFTAVSAAVNVNPPMCTSSANACGQTNYGACPQDPPANPAGYGNACNSAPNACGQTNSGTTQCDGSCSASTPSNSGCAVTSCTVNGGTTPITVTAPATVSYAAVGGGAPFTWTPSDGGGAYGSASTASRSLTSANAGNTYGMSVSTPGGSANCPNVNVAATWCTTGSAALTITATPDRVKAGATTHIAWTGTNVQGHNTVCTITGPGLNQTSTPGALPSCSLSGSSTVDPTISTQSTYTITCGADSKSVIVNVAPVFQEF